MSKENPADRNAARQEAMYREEPKGGAKKQKVEEAATRVAPNGKDDGVKDGGRDEIHARHKRERDDAHDRHKKERDDMHKRHQGEHDDINARQETELATMPPGGDQTNPQVAASTAAPVAAPAQASGQGA